MLGERKQRVVLTPKMYQSINYMISKDKKTKEIVEFHKDEFDLSKSSVLKIMREIFDCDDFDGLLEKVENRASGRELKENKMVIKRRELIRESLSQDGSNTLKRLQNLLESNGIYVSQTTIKTDIEKMNFRRKRLKNGNLIWVPNDEDDDKLDGEYDDIVEDIDGDVVNEETDMSEIITLMTNNNNNHNKDVIYFRRITFSLPKSTPYLFSITKKAIDQVDIVTLIMVMTKRELIGHKIFSGPLSADILNDFLGESLVPRLMAKTETTTVVGETTKPTLIGPRILYMENGDAIVDMATAQLCKRHQIQIKAVHPSAVEFQALERIDLFIHSKYREIQEKTVENVIKSLDDIVVNHMELYK